MKLLKKVIVYFDVPSLIAFGALTLIILFLVTI